MLKNVFNYYEDNHIDSLVVCGINDIYIMLQDLAEKMTEVKEFLNRISDNVKTMSDDVLENIKTALEKQ